MPPTPKPDWKVELSIVTSETNGYTESNVDGYYYKYTGGNTTANNGDITIDKDNHSSDGYTIEVSLKGASNGAYDIKSGDIKTSTTDISVTSPSNNKVTITDTESINNETVDYGVTVNPKNATSPDIKCDPAIIHTW